MITTDYLVIGSGIAGLTFAVKMAEQFPEKKVLIVTKSNEEESNTKYAQGGIAIVLNEKEDSFEQHIQDTLIAGDGLCDQDVVTMVVKEGPKRFNELVTWGTHFDTNTNGHFNLGKEGGHSQYRVAHHKDCTGYEIETALLNRIHQLSNITTLSQHFALDLITTANICHGAYIINQNNHTVITVQASATLLCTGGIGTIYGHTTNPSIATGDGIAMAIRAQATIADMEFIQFHPTVLHEKSEGASFLISEAVRGFGAYLRNQNGDRFMLGYDARAELASRDIVSRCIDNELKKEGHTHVFLDCTHLDLFAFKKHFPTIYEKCLAIGIDITTDWIPVVPAAHYICGGINVDQNGQTSIKNLFACGECTRTGLHGANRLASNSLLEALVYAHNTFTYLSTILDTSTVTITLRSSDISLRQEQVSSTLITTYRQQLQELMHRTVGIIRTTAELVHTKTQIEQWIMLIDHMYSQTQFNLDLAELRNMLYVSLAIVKQSLARKHNKGGFFNTDNESLTSFSKAI
ncbi:L-aspartate oxidase [Aquimarina rhabdastrellae]